MRAKATHVECRANEIIVKLEDGRVVHTPLSWFPKLKGAKPKDRKNFRLVADGAGVRWDALDQDLAVAAIVDSNDRPLEHKGPHKCRGCGYQAKSRWEFRCPGCGGFFNVLTQNSRSAPGFNGPGGGHGDADFEAISLNSVYAPEIQRISTAMENVDYILGGGFVPGSLNLLTGAPGQGKSTLILAILQSLAKLHETVLYITGEESLAQIKQRADRLGRTPAKLKAIAATELDVMLDQADAIKPTVMVVDSIQTVQVDEDIAEGIASIKAALREFSRFCKNTDTAMIIIGHVTKEGAIAGPRSLEHMVDAVFSFDKGKRSKDDRVLRCPFKNRFHQAGIETHFTMTDKGLIACPLEVDEYDEDGEVKETTTPKKRYARGEPVPPQPAQPPPPSKPDLKSVPPDASAFWTAPDGTSAKTVLAVKCDVVECRGSIGKACDASDGKREVGFHESRVLKAKLRLEDEPVVAEDEEELTPKDPFDKPFGAPPRKSRKKPRPKK